MRTYGFGIDGGGTRSRLRVFDWETGEEICRLVGESTNMYSVGTDRAQANAMALLAAAGLPPEAYRGGCIGSAGLGREAERRSWQAFVEERLPRCPVYLCNDGETLLVGSLQDTSGYALIAGTGSLALGRSPSGDVVRAGGLGDMLGDEGSALWIGWQAINRSLRAAEGRDLPTSLLPKLMAHFSLDRAEDFVALMHRRFAKSEIASAAKCVLEDAPADPLAADIAAGAVRELVSLVQSVVRRLPEGTMRLAMSGGVLENSALIRERVQAALAADYPEMRFVVGEGDAVMGACMLAVEHAGKGDAVRPHAP
ncbi:MAG: BadF/BadG/BcrA/BcrD ATPase family protein [Clostridia bacterium]|nr:BadF/BadG/BcrA/BcrD ATPase family protein [Clostridia bacterium]